MSVHNAVLVCLTLLILYLFVRMVNRRQNKKVVKDAKEVVQLSEVVVADQEVVPARNRRIRFGADQVKVFNPHEPPYTISDLNYSGRQLNSMDRIRNPLRYPYKSIPAFQGSIDYANRGLPFQVASSGGWRAIPTLENVPIINPPDQIDIGNQNIAPTNVSVRGGIGLPQQVGVLHKLFGNDNDVYPLYGRKRYPRDEKWDYYTTMGKYGVKLRVRNADGRQRYQELNSNDEVVVEGVKDRYRVTIYQTDFPQYIPWVQTFPQ